MVCFCLLGVDHQKCLPEVYCGFSKCD
uniref:Uncharacterized protein n=1 Tax=Anguilla anguilla TaxID=7936 RepID=A0A0E9UW44_ANGAN